jgi:type IV secretion system protein VirB10
VRAVTGFPVTVGTQLAIPAGTYVEGVIDKVTKDSYLGRSVQMHFTRVVYANGYSVAIDGVNTQAKALGPQPGSPDAAAFAGESGWSTALTAPSAPTLPPLPNPGPHIGTVVGIAAGAAAAGIVTIVLMTHHGDGGGGVLFDTGWQFVMVLQSPLSVDAASVAAALGTPGAH